MKRQFKQTLKRLAGPFFPVFVGLESAVKSHFSHDEAAAQIALMQQYRSLAFRGRERLPDFRDTGFRKYSQFEEDGILLYLFSLISPLTRTCVEICAGSGRECNTANLIINHGWWGYLFDGNKQNVKAGRAFFSHNRNTFLHPPQFTQAWITAENVNDLLSRSGVSGPIDLLSLDIDGMDYWVWKAITIVEPQVVVCETSNPIPPDRALTVPYAPRFVAKTEDFQGASLAAMCKLGCEKGYRLIGTNRFGFNAFFMKNGVGEEFFPEVDAASCVQDPYSQLARRERWPKVKGCNWQEV